MYDANMNYVSATLTEPIRGGENCINTVNADLSDFKFGNCNNNALWGINPLGYEDIPFIMEWWTGGANDITFYQPFTIRVQNKCVGKTIAMNTEGPFTTYAGATLVKSSLYASTTVALNADCNLFSYV